jgi:hypothetical protein
MHLTGVQQFTILHPIQTLELPLNPALTQDLVEEAGCLHATEPVGELAQAQHLLSLGVQSCLFLKLAAQDPMCVIDGGGVHFSVCVSVLMCVCA